MRVSRTKVSSAQSAAASDPREPSATRQQTFFPSFRFSSIFLVQISAIVLEICSTPKAFIFFFQRNLSL